MSKQNRPPSPGLFSVEGYTQAIGCVFLIGIACTTAVVGSGIFFAARYFWSLLP